MCDTIKSRIEDLAWNNLVGVIASVNNYNQQIIQTNKNYN